MIASWHDRDVSAVLTRIVVIIIVCDRPRRGAPVIRRGRCPTSRCASPTPDTNAPLPGHARRDPGARVLHHAGLLSHPEATRAARTADGWFKTGDSARLARTATCASSGGWATALHRTRASRVVGGESRRCSPEAPDVATCAIFAFPTPRAARSGVAFVVPKPGSVCDQETISGFCLVASYQQGTCSPSASFRAPKAPPGPEVPPQGHRPRRAGRRGQ